MSMKQPPNSIDAEQAVIGCVLSFPECFQEVEFLAAEDFYHMQNRTLWERIKRSESGRDMVAVLMDMESLEDKLYASDLCRSSPTAANVKVYANVIRDRAILRRLLAECMSIASEITNDARPADIIAGSIRRIEAIGDGAIVGTGPRHISDISPVWYEEYRTRANNLGKVGLSTGFDALDSRWGGLRGGQVLVIAGRPKTGKTTLAVNIAEHIAQTNPVAVFQMEMGEAEMVDRAIASTGRVSITKIRNGEANSQEDVDNLLHALNVLKSSKLYIDATPRQTINYIRMHAKAFVKRHGKGAILIDYLGLIRPEGSSRSKNDEVAEISRDIKLLAKETDCPVILLCQMNRGVEKEKRKPQLSDLRDSGAIEQDADIIAFTHKDDPEQDYSEIITRAMRSGVPGTDYLLCQFGISRFASTPEMWAPPVTASSGTNRRSGLK